MTVSYREFLDNTLCVALKDDESVYLHKLEMLSTVAFGLGFCEMLSRFFDEVGLQHPKEEFEVMFEKSFAGMICVNRELFRAFHRVSAAAEAVCEEFCAFDLPMYTKLLKTEI